MVKTSFITAGVLALCIALATTPQLVAGDILQDFTKGGAKAFDSAFATWSEYVASVSCPTNLN